MSNPDNMHNPYGVPDDARDAYGVRGAYDGRSAYDEGANRCDKTIVMPASFANKGYAAPTVRRQRIAQSPQPYDPGSDSEYAAYASPQGGYEPRPIPSPSPRPMRKSTPEAMRPERADYYASTVERAVSGLFHGITGSLVSVFCQFIAVLCRVFAWMLSLIIVGSALPFAPLRFAFLMFYHTVSRILPPVLVGSFIIESPFGGILRGDYVIVTLILFVLDHLLCRLAFTLRNSR
ncbi:hypothetical protein [Fannyhessea vaginae]|uniref:Uncharacterized protein n=1 Tax=Fannyhessea vaginae DSM 15829 TaxID=525256 RepID=F1T683_9ACTN|nr:hypothetical protein [Fannyhessea vaginae]EGF22988.1 hypothetical protein HMPREF0091_10983 [Fannyhessea vaginae DSM 15829]QPR42292.1 hypothetical protein I6G91_03040 [Fannyhessea vaginae]SSZ02428.1 Uncharacterised protein [Fannyhessea vaginae]